jgi:hypothetical protein
MAGENEQEDNNETWLEIDLGNKGEGKVEVQNTTSEPDKSPETTIPEKDEQQEDGKRVQKRINDLTRKRKEAEDRAALAQQENENLKRQLAEQGKGAVERDKVALNTYKSGVEAKLAAAEAKFQDAFDAGDKAKLLEAQREMSNLTFELNAIKLSPVPEAPKVEEQKPKAKPQATPDLPEATKDWMNDNPWFGTGEGKDRRATALAIELSDELIADGMDPTSEEFYQEVNKRLVEELPRAKELIEGKKADEPRKKVPNPVSGQSRRSSGGNKITLDGGEQKHAKSLGVSNEAYARQKAQIEKDKAERDDGYTTIIIGAGRK